MSPRARAAGRGAAPVAFRGPPHRLSSLVPLPEIDTPAEPKVLVEGAEIRGFSVRPLTREGGAGVGKLTLRLARATSPGTYPGSVELGGRKHPFVVEVEPQPKIEVSPSHLTFEVEPGAEASAEVTLHNVGNVPFEVPAASSFCVFDGGGVDRAFWVALGAEPPSGKERIDLLLDTLAEAHGGLVEVRARAKPRTIAPGEPSEVQLTLSFSDRIRPGHGYVGSWDAEGLRVRVRVSVPSTKGRRG